MPSDSPKRQPSPPSNTKKDPDDWTSGDDPMTGAQASYLKTLSEEAHHRDVRLTPTCPEERRQERQNYHSGGSAEACSVSAVPIDHHLPASRKGGDGSRVASPGNSMGCGRIDTKALING
jgi:Protein of unknown function (DUF3072)